jgi:hypothetical protein
MAASGFHTDWLIDWLVFNVQRVMVSVLATSVIDLKFEPDQVKQKTIKLVFVAYPLSMLH